MRGSEANLSLEYPIISCYHLFILFTLINALVTKNRYIVSKYNVFFLFTLINTFVTEKILSANSLMLLYKFCILEVYLYQALKFYVNDHLLHVQKYYFC